MLVNELADISCSHIDDKTASLLSDVLMNNSTLIELSIF